MTSENSHLKKSIEVRIIEAAAHLFSHHGFKATPTREIAQLAKVNEATLFRYFPKKQDLFWAAVESRLNRVKLGRELQASLAADIVPSMALPMLVDFFLKTFSQPQELSRLVQVAMFELPEADEIIRAHLGPIFEVINGYFSRCAARGDIGNVDPSLATLGLIGVVTAHRGWHKFFTGKPLPNSDSQQAIAVYVQLWLEALKQPATEAVPRASFASQGSKV